MEINELKLKEVYEIILKPLMDERGFFMRSYDDKLFKDAGLNFNWVQENHSRSIQKGVIRGLHFQRPPFSEAKLVRCVRGSILDVFVDLRKNSSTLGKWDCIELSETNFKSVLIPRGFAHGFCTLVNDCEVLYKVDNFYSPPYELGLIWNDTELNIAWPENNPILSEKDKRNLTLREFIYQYNWIEV